MKSCHRQYFKKYPCVCTEIRRKGEISVNFISRFAEINRQEDSQIQKGTWRSDKVAIISISWRDVPSRDLGRRTAITATRALSIRFPYWNRFSQIRRKTWTRSCWKTTRIGGCVAYRRTSSWENPWVESILALVWASPKGFQWYLWDILKANQQGLHQERLAQSSKPFI